MMPVKLSLRLRRLHQKQHRARELLQRLNQLLVKNLLLRLNRQEMGLRKRQLVISLLEPNQHHPREVQKHQAKGLLQLNHRARNLLQLGLLKLSQQAGQVDNEQLNQQAIGFQLLNQRLRLLQVHQQANKYEDKNEEQEELHRVNDCLFCITPL